MSDRIYRDMKAPALIQMPLDTYSLKGAKVEITTGKIISGTKSQALEILTLAKNASYAAQMLPKLHF